MERRTFLKSAFSSFAWICGLSAAEVPALVEAALANPGLTPIRGPAEICEIQLYAATDRAGGWLRVDEVRPVERCLKAFQRPSQVSMRWLPSSGHSIYVLAGSEAVLRTHNCVVLAFGKSAGSRLAWMSGRSHPIALENPMEA